MDKYSNEKNNKLINLLNKSIKYFEILSQKMDNFHKSIIVQKKEELNSNFTQKKSQSRAFKSNLMNITSRKLSKPLVNNKENKKIYSIKNHYMPNIVTEDLEIKDSKLISFLSKNGINSESNHKKTIHIQFNRKIKKYKNETNVDRNDIVYNKTTFVNSNKKIEENLSLLINKNISVINNNYFEEQNKNKNVNIKKKIFLNGLKKRNKSNYTKSIKSINYILKTPKKLNETQKFPKNINIIKNKIIPLSQNHEANSFKFAFSESPKSTFNKSPANTEGNEKIKERKGNLNFLKKNEIISKRKQIKINKNFSNNKKGISIFGYKNNKYIIRNQFYEIALNEKIKTDNSAKEKEKEDNFNKTYSKENKPIDNLLSKTNEQTLENKNFNSTINNVLHFNEINHILNRFIKRSPIKNQSKNESSNYNEEKNSNNHNKINNIVSKKNTSLKINWDNMINKKKSFLKINNNIKSQKKINGLKIKKDYIKGKNSIKGINLEIKRNKIKFQNKKERKNKLYQILKCDNFIGIIFSFCENDINLLNKITMISKDIFRRIKPFIYKKIYNRINNSNEKNKIKIYLMKSNSSLINLSSSILYIKYNELLFQNSKYDIDIKKDLTRTFPDNILFQYGNIYYNKLYHILISYSNLNKNIGYVQGINYLAAHIINIFEDEIDALIFLDALINKLNLDKILYNNLNNKYYDKISNNINLFIIDKLPKLYKYLSDIKLNIDFFTTSWILTLFSDSMETELLSIIWDYMIIFGWKFVKHFIVNILLIFENDILNTTQNKLTHLKKNILRNEKFKNNFRKILIGTEEMLINDVNIV